MIKTDIIILGAQKSATTSLFDMMTRSPDIVGSDPKEPDYFSVVQDWRADLDQYHSIYSPKNGTLYLEASTSYTFFPHRNLRIWDDLYAYNPDLRFIYVVRKPSDRIASHYAHMWRRGYFSGSIREFALGEPLALSVSRYYAQIIPFIETFGRQQVLILRYEDVISGDANGKVATFLGLEPDAFGHHPSLANESKNLRHHRFSQKSALWRVASRASPRVADRLARLLTPSLRAKPVLDAEVASAITRVLETDIRALERLTGFDLTKWRDTEVRQA